MDKIKDYYTRNPLTFILLSALLARLISAFFSRGYGMIDDQFLVIEPVQSWLDGYNLDGWLPGRNTNNTKPAGFSMLYPGLHYYFFLLLEKIGIAVPAHKMVLVRILHAFGSLLVVRWGYKISENLGGKTAAEYTGWMLALLWFMPMMSVRNLVEMVCILPLMYTTWLLVKAEDQDWKLFLLAGIVGGLAFSVRFQTFTFVAGLGMVLFFQKRWQQVFLFGIGVVVSIFLVQGGIDYFVWGRPFIQFEAYTLYNLSNAYNYIIGPWYNYLILIPGLLVPPLGLFLFFGYFLAFRKHPILFYPALLFIIFHSLFPNKQERFILPVVPFVLMAGILCWTQFYENSKFWQSRTRLYKGLIRFSVIANCVLLVFLTPASTKISLMDAMTYLSEKNGDHPIVFENTNSNSPIILPRFYLRHWVGYTVLMRDSEFLQIPSLFSGNQLSVKDSLPVDLGDFKYVVFGQVDNLETRVANFEKSHGKIVFEAHIRSSYLDDFMHWLNPFGNKSQDCFVYKRI